MRIRIRGKRSRKINYVDTTMAFMEKKKVFDKQHAKWFDIACCGPGFFGQHMSGTTNTIYMLFKNGVKHNKYITNIYMLFGNSVTYNK